MSSLKSSHTHTVYVGTKDQCTFIMGVLEPTLTAEGLTAALNMRPAYRHKPERYEVRCDLLPQVAHTIVTLSRGGEIRRPIADTEILEYLGAQEGNMREWVAYAVRGLVPTRGKGEPEYDPLAEFPAPVSPPDDPMVEVRE